MEEATIGSFLLSGETAWMLGTDNVGLFIGGIASLSVVIEKLQGLESLNSSATWVVIAATKKMAAVFVHRWFAPTENRIAVTALKLPKRRANVMLATPETLRHIPRDSIQNVAGLILVDMLCHVHCARQIGSPGGFSVANDRPQMIADFRYSLSIDGWAPPLIIVTQKPAKAVYTDNIARTYCLEGLWFIDGKYFGIRSETAELDPPTNEDAH
jgi:hypothetical protein